MMSQGLWRMIWMGSGLACLALIAAVLWLRPGDDLAHGQDSATIRIGSGLAHFCTNDTVRLDALDVPAPGLGSYAIDVSYNPLVADPVDCVEDPDGVIYAPSCNPDYAPGVVRCGGFEPSDGLTGQVALCDITFHCASDSDHCSDLTLTVSEFFDTKTNPIANDIQDGEFCCECLDPDGDTICDDGDASGTAGDRPCNTGQPEDCDDNCPDTANADQLDGPDDDGLGNACDPDDDNDLMPDTYEDDHDACLNPLAKDGSLDPDNDTLTSFGEMTMGTDPCTYDLPWAGQSDDDDYSDGLEMYLGTDTDAGCPLNQSHDAWPPDLNGGMGCDTRDGVINLLDVLCYRPVILSCLGDPNFDQRFDLNADGCINLLDVLQYRPVILTECTTP